MVGAMKTIVFIESNQFGTSKEAITIAKRMGYCVLLFTAKRNPINTSTFPDVDHFVFFYSLFNKNKLIEEINAFQKNGYQICACLSFLDPYISYAAKLAKQLGLFGLSIEALSVMENKIFVRETLKGLSSSPFFAVFMPNTPINIFAKEYEPYLPFIIKSPASNGSKDVMLVKNLDELKKGLHSLQKKMQNPLPILIEEYLLGPQYLIEVLVHNGKTTIVGVIEQEILEGDAFIVIGYHFPASIKEEELSSLLECVNDIINQLGLTDGSCHLEMRLAQGGWKLVEINPRMSGGAMNIMIEEGTGINLVEEILKMNLGEQPSLEKTRNQHVYTQYVTINTSGRLLKVTGEERARNHKGIQYVYVKPVEGSILTIPFSMGNRYACVVAAADSAEQAKASAIEAAQEIRFYLEPL